jgi:large subunit ribosomal protein L21
MYAVIRTGGKQEKVTEGQRVRVERLGVDEGADVTFEPLLLVDGESVVAGADLGTASVTGRVVGLEKGPKIRGF